MNENLKDYVKRKFLLVAKDLIKNPDALLFRIESAKEKISKKSVMKSLGNSLEDLKRLIRLLLAWKNGQYKNVGKQTILYTIVAIIYFVTPTDFVPDFLLGLGLVDDIAVISWVLSLIKEDLEKFKKWEDTKRD